MKIVSLVVGVLFTLIALSMLLFSHFLSALFMLIAALIITPKTKGVIQTCFAKENGNIEIPNSMAFVAGFIFFIVSAIFMNQKTAQAAAVQPINNIIKVNTHRVYINEVHKLQQLTDKLINHTYLPPHPSYEDFTKTTENLATSIKPTCDYFDELVKQNAYINSQHNEQAIRCIDTVLSMINVMFDIRDGEHNSIKEQRQKLIIINANLLNQLEEYKKTPEFQEKINKNVAE
jgi:hypothetical protein